jgi:hypothetical protein
MVMVRVGVRLGCTFGLLEFNFISEEFPPRERFFLAAIASPPSE